MKIHMVCPSCINAWVTDDRLPLQEDITAALVVNQLHNSLFYEFVCSAGHTNKVVLQNTKFELLFDSGINALRDGYYREAVSSFAVALERFYEYSIRVMLSPSILDIGKENFEKTWKVMSKQSERQLGAFFILYLSTYKVPAPLFDSAFLKTHSLNLGFQGNDPIGFRNKAIHEGFLPSLEQAIAFGEAVNLYIRYLLKDYKASGFDILAPTVEDVRLTYAQHTQEHLHTECKNTFMSMTREDALTNGRSLIEFMQSSYLRFV